jgi:hypothetical protein
LKMELNRGNQLNEVTEWVLMTDVLLARRNLDKDMCRRKTV